MKKTFRFIGMALMAVLVSVGFAACIRNVDGDDDENEKKQENQEQQEYDDNAQQDDAASGQTLTIIDPADANEYSFCATGISPNGKWIIGDDSGSEYSMYSFPCILNVQKWNEKKAVYATGNRYGSFADVNNNGYACGWIADDDGNDGVGYAAPWSTGSEDRHWAKGFVYYKAQAPIDAVDVYDINENNTILGTLRYMYTNNNYYVEPVLWTCSDEQEVNMVNLPMPTEMIENLSYYKVIPMKISEDETTIIGYACGGDYGSRYIPLKWSVENGQYVCKALSSKNIEPMFYTTDHVYTTPYLSFWPSCVSDNCEWIGGELYDTERNLFIARYNVKTDLFDVLTSSSGPGNALITNDGTMIWSYTISTSEEFYSTAYYWMPNSSAPIDIRDAFPVIKDFKDFYVNGISSDGKTIVGTQLCSDGNKIFVLTDVEP